jgi:hypothetical protein
MVVCARSCWASIVHWRRAIVFSKENGLSCHVGTNESSLLNVWLRHTSRLVLERNAQTRRLSFVGPGCIALVDMYVCCAPRCVGLTLTRQRARHNDVIEPVTSCSSVRLRAKMHTGRSMSAGVHMQGPLSSRGSPSGLTRGEEQHFKACRSL